jgi:hypothetical protein
MSVESHRGFVFVPFGQELDVGGLSQCVFQVRFLLDPTVLVCLALGPP